MQTKNIDELIQELQRLQEKQSKVIQEIAQARREQQQQSSDEESTGKANTSGSKQKGKEKTISRSRGIVSIFERKRSANWTHQPTDEEFQIRDRVYITNKVTARGRFRNSDDRKATVTNVTRLNSPDGPKVHLLTDNGATTWRLPKNLNKLIETTDSEDD